MYHALGIVLGFFVQEFQLGAHICTVFVRKRDQTPCSIADQETLIAQVAPTGQLITAAVMMLPLSLAFDQPWTLRPSFVALGSLAILSLLGTAFAYILYYWLIEHTGATRTALVTYLIPITGIVWGAAILSEPIEWEAVLALLLIVAGIGLVNRRGAPAHGTLTVVPAEGE